MQRPRLSGLARNRRGGDATAQKILAAHRAELEAGVELLIDNEGLSAEQFAPQSSKEKVGGQVAA